MLESGWSRNVRVSRDFEVLYFCKADVTESHHEVNKSTQRTFHQNVTSLVETLEDLGNPFTVRIGSHLIQRILQIVLLFRLWGKLKILGKKCIKRLWKTDASNTKRRYYENLISLFRTPIVKTATKEKFKISLLKNDCSLFSRLCTSYQTHRGNV